ncbi:MAG: hypothetical protein GYB65_19990 [Chloroflexi bacterium]|nr:hypothetical protein [Chloroflexota bacterium]
MTFENLQTSRIIIAVAATFIVAIPLYFVVAGVALVLSPVEMQRDLWDIMEESFDPETDEFDQGAYLDNVEAFQEEYRAEFTLQSVFNWTLVIVTTLVTAWWACRQAYSTEHATGQGLVVGAGVALTYGGCCVMCNGTVDVLLRLVFFGGLFVAGLAGGWLAGQNVDPNRQPPPKPAGRPGSYPYGPYGAPPGGPYGAPSSGPQGGPYNGPQASSSSLSPPDIPPSAPGGFMPGTTPGMSPDVMYNMGVSAALGGRREEARQHFTHVLQMNPRHLAAWLQLANLAETPQQAWNYIQQARAINPNDPAVLQAVDTIWPQVHRQAMPSGAADEATPDAGPPDIAPPDIVPPDAGPPDMTPPESVDQPDEPGDDLIL